MDQKVVVVHLVYYVVEADIRRRVTEAECGGSQSRTGPRNSCPGVSHTVSPQEVSMCETRDRQHTINSTHPFPPTNNSVDEPSEIQYISTMRRNRPQAHMRTQGDRDSASDKDTERTIETEDTWQYMFNHNEQNTSPYRYGSGLRIHCTCCGIDMYSFLHHVLRCRAKQRLAIPTQLLYLLRQRTVSPSSPTASPLSYGATTTAAGVAPLLLPLISRSPAAIFTIVTSRLQKMSSCVVQVAQRQQVV